MSITNKLRKHSGQLTVKFHASLGYSGFFTSFFTNTRENSPRKLQANGISIFPEFSANVLCSLSLTLHDSRILLVILFFGCARLRVFQLSLPCSGRSAEKNKNAGKFKLFKRETSANKTIWLLVSGFYLVFERDRFNLQATQFHDSVRRDGQYR